MGIPENEPTKSLPHGHRLTQNKAALVYRANVPSMSDTGGVMGVREMIKSNID